MRRRQMMAQQMQDAVVSTIGAPVVPDKDACPKCGRVVKQGKVMHVRWCKGK